MGRDLPFPCCGGHMTKIRIKPVHLLFVLPAVLLNLIFFLFIH